MIYYIHADNRLHFPPQEMPLEGVEDGDHLLCLQLQLLLKCPLGQDILCSALFHLLLKYWQVKRVLRAMRRHILAKPKEENKTPLGMKANAFPVIINTRSCPVLTQ